MKHWMNEARVLHHLPELPESELPRGDDAETSIKARRQAAARERERLVTLSEMMKIPEARAWMHDLLSKAGAFGPVGFATDAIPLARLLGRHDIGQSILADLHRACPAEYLIMLKEANSHERSNDGPATD